MNNPNKNNRIIFLTTLSVYLGLVLVGGAPQVLAQTANAINKNLAVKNIDKCDSADLMGNEARRLIYKLGYKGEFVGYLPTHIKYAFDEDDLQGVFDVSVSLNFSEDGYPTYSIIHSEKQRIFEKSDFDTVEIIEAAIELSKSYAVFQKKDGLKVYFPTTVKTVLNEEEFYVSVNFPESTTERAKDFADAYKYFIEEGICLYDSNDLSEALSKNTTVFSENNQIFIVTRLPRGSLDKFVKKDAKAENK